jgi:hypothetical protein
MNNEFPFDTTQVVTHHAPTANIDGLDPVSRREFLRQGGFGATSLILTGAAGMTAGAIVVPDPGCSKASIEVEVSTAITFLNKVSSLLPGKAQIIAKIVAALNDFNKFYQAGDFTSAGKFFSTVDADFTQLITDLGVNLSPSVKIALALVDAALAAIGVLMKSQAGAPGVPSKAAMSDEQRQMALVIERRAAKAEKLFAAIQP